MVVYSSIIISIPIIIDESFDGSPRISLALDPESLLSTYVAHDCRVATFTTWYNNRVG